MTLIVSTSRTLPTPNGLRFESAIPWLLVREYSFHRGYEWWVSTNIGMTRGKCDGETTNFCRNRELSTNEDKHA